LRDGTKIGIPEKLRSHDLTDSVRWDGCEIREGGEAKAECSSPSNARGSTMGQGGAQIKNASWELRFSGPEQIFEIKISPTSQLSTNTTS